MNKTKKKIVAITICLVYDLFIDLFHVGSQYISQFIVANERNNAGSNDDYTESDASDSQADGNKNIPIIFWKSSLILLVKRTSTRQMFGSSNLKK